MATGSAAMSLPAGGSATRREGRFGETGGRVALGLVLPLVVLTAWQLLGPVFFTEYQLPPPAKVLQSAWVYVVGDAAGGQYSGTFVTDLTASLQRVLSGFAVGSLVGVPLGLAIGFSRRVAQVVEPSISVLRSIPGIAWLPLAIIWFGFGHTSSVFLVALGSFFPVCISTIQGVRFIDPNLVLASLTLGASRRQAVTSVALPAAIPSVLNGLRLGLAYSWIYMILGEFTGVNKGLGAALMHARDTMRTDIVITLMIIIGLLGVITDWPVQRLFQRVFRTDVR